MWRALMSLSFSNTIKHSPVPQNKVRKLTTVTFLEQLPCSRHWIGCIKCIIGNPQATPHSIPQNHPTSGMRKSRFHRALGMWPRSPSLPVAARESALRSSRGLPTAPCCLLSSVVWHLWPLVWSQPTIPLLITLTAIKGSYFIWDSTLS